MLVFTKLKDSQSAPLIGGLAVLALAAIALALPPSPIPMAKAQPDLGVLQAVALFSDGVAEQNARNGYGYLALDISTASGDKDAYWRQQVDLVSARRYPVWGWIDLSRASGDVEQIVASLNLSGVYLYGADSVARATSLSASRSDIAIVPVLPSGSRGASQHAMTVDLDTYLDTNAGEYALPVLVGDQLNESQIQEALAHARDLAGKDGTPKLLIARIPLVYN
ncbi:MAG: hypothetical protein AAGD14_17960 [Planctomycetota bacterium]